MPGYGCAGLKNFNLNLILTCNTFLLYWKLKGSLTALYNVSCTDHHGLSNYRTQLYWVVYLHVVVHSNIKQTIKSGNSLYNIRLCSNISRWPIFVPNNKRIFFFLRNYLYWELLYISQLQLIGFPLTFIRPHLLEKRFRFIFIILVFILDSSLVR